MEYKKLRDFTIKEFKYYETLLTNIEENLDEIFNLYEVQKPLSEMTINEYNSILKQLVNERPENENKIIQKTYDINDTKYSIELDMFKINAAQFINIQTAVASKQIEKILSCFLIPMVKSKSFFGKTIWKKQKYGSDNYSTSDVEYDILNYFKIGDALNINFFFMNYTEKLLKVFHQSLAKKNMKMKQKELKARKKNLIQK